VHVRLLLIDAELGWLLRYRHSTHWPGFGEQTAQACANDFVKWESRSDFNRL